MLEPREEIIVHFTFVNTYAGRREVWMGTSKVFAYPDADNDYITNSVKKVLEPRYECFKIDRIAKSGIIEFHEVPVSKFELKS